MQAMEDSSQEKVLRIVESILRDAEGFANQSLSTPARERGLDREVMALAIHEALVTLRKARG
jgi:hypothetical protein